MSNDKPLSVQLYTVRDAIALNLDAALARVAAIGFQTVEVYDFAARASEYATALATHGLRPSSGHAPLLEGDVPAILAAAQQLGISTVVDPSGGRDRWGTLEGVQFNAAMLNARAKVAADAGIQVGYHNHWWEFESIGGRPALEVFAELLEPAVVLEVDAYWAQVGGGDAVGTLERLGDRVHFIHVKDGPITREGQDQVAVGAGLMPIPDVLAAAPQAVRVVELDGTRGDVFQALEESYAYLAGRGEA